MRKMKVVTEGKEEEGWRLREEEGQEMQHELAASGLDLA